MFPLHPHDPPAIGPYRPRARLGEDAHARVYLCASDDGGPVVVRILRPEQATEPTFRAAFAHRVEAVRGLSGTHVGAVRDADTRSAVPWVAVSRPLGPTLAELVSAHGPLPAEALPPLALGLAQGLADLHARIPAHGSLRPDGVLVAGHAAMLADPGLEWTGSEVGPQAPHPTFGAPEGGASPATDVFSWAAVLSYAAGGVEGPEGLDRVPLQLRGLVDACLKRDPRLRPSANDLVRMLGGPTEAQAWPPTVRAAIDAVAERQRSTLVSPVPPGAPASRWAGNRRRLLVSGAGVLAMVILTAGALHAYGRLTAPSEEVSGSEPTKGSLITEGGCLDATGYPPPPDDPISDDAHVSHLAFSADGDVLAVAAGSTLMVWDWREGEEIARPSTSHSGVGPAPVFSPTGCTLVAAVEVDREGHEYPNRFAHSHDLRTGTTVRHLGPQEAPDEDGHWMASPKDVQAFDFSPEGGRLAITLDPGVQGGGSTHVVDTATGEAGEPMADTRQYGTRFVDEEHFVTNDHGEIHLWNAVDGAEVHSFRGASDISLSVVPGASRIAYLNGDRVVVADPRSGAEVASFTRDVTGDDEEPILTQLLLDPHRDVVYATWLASEGEEYTYHRYAWDLETGENLLEGIDDLVPYRHLALHPDGEVIAATLVDDRAAPTLLDPNTHERIDTLY